VVWMSTAWMTGPSTQTFFCTRSPGKYRSGSQP
jgi:hypothetical protein